MADEARISQEAVVAVTGSDGAARISQAAAIVVESGSGGAAVSQLAVIVVREYRIPVTIEAKLRGGSGRLSGQLRTTLALRGTVRGGGGRAIGLQQAGIGFPTSIIFLS
jgi:hypothetical protein